MFRHYIILFFLWVSYCVLHSLLASERFKNKATKFLGYFFKFYRTIYSVIALIFLFVILSFQLTFTEVSLYQPATGINIIALITASAGISIMAVCSGKYFRFIAGLKMERLKKKADNLHTTGINSVIRHPLYAGTLIFIWSLFLLFPFMSNFISCVIITIYVFIGLKFEEQKLLAKYGAIYTNYKAMVPMFIPNLQKMKAKFTEKNCNRMQS